MSDSGLLPPLPFVVPMSIPLTHPVLLALARRSIGAHRRPLEPLPRSLPRAGSNNPVLTVFSIAYWWTVSLLVRLFDLDVGTARGAPRSEEACGGPAAAASET